MGIPPLPACGLSTGFRRWTGAVIHRGRVTSSVSMPGGLRRSRPLSWPLGGLLISFFDLSKCLATLSDARTLPSIDASAHGRHPPRLTRAGHSTQTQLCPGRPAPRLPEAWEPYPPASTLPRCSVSSTPKPGTRHPFPLLLASTR